MNILVFGVYFWLLTFDFFHLLEHFSSLEFSSEPLKQSETPSQSLLILKICRTSAVSFTWQPKKPSSRFTKKTSFPLPPENCEFTLVHVNTEDHRSIRTRHSILAWNRRFFFRHEYNWNRRRYHYWWICGTQNITSETDDYETEGDIINHWFVKGCRSWHSMNCQKKFSNFRPFLAISPNAGSIILTREAQQRRSQNSSPNRFHSSDMRAFLGVHAKCCQHMLFFISRTDKRKSKTRRQRPGDRICVRAMMQQGRRSISVTWLV